MHFKKEGFKIPFLFRSKKEEKKTNTEQQSKINEEIYKINEKISKIEEEFSRIYKEISELSNHCSEISERISQLSKEVSKNSKRIEILTKALISLDEDKQDLKGKVEKYKFFIAVQEMKEKNILPLGNKYIDFIEDIIKILPKEATPEFPLSFQALVKALWNKLYPKWWEKFSIADCHNALSVLESETDILHCYEKAQGKFYVFNPNSEFLKKISH